MRGRHLILLGLCGWMLSTGSASAQTGVPAYDLERLDLNPSGVGTFLVGDGELLRPGGMRFSLLAHYERNALLLYSGNQSLGAVVRNRVTLHLTAAWAITSRFELGAVLPYLVSQRGDDLTAYGIDRPRSQGLGAPLLLARFGILQEKLHHPFSLAVQGGVDFPTGTNGALGHDSYFEFVPKVQLGKQFGILTTSVEAGARLRHATQLGDEMIRSQFIWGLGLSLGNDWVRGELSGRSAIGSGGIHSNYDLLAGLRFFILRGFEAFVEGGPGFGKAEGSPSYRVLGGVSLGWDPQVSPEPAAVSATPLPLPIAVSVVKPTPVVPPPVLDSDGDGILDPEDACPTERGSLSNGGCPIRDQDKDGIPDDKDACPREAGPPDRNGCPIKDADNDGVEDSQDNCPKEAGPVSNQGCPVRQRQLVIITRDKIEIKDKVYFKTADAKLLSKSYRLLDQVARVLVEHPDIQKVVIEGHTDSVGVGQTNRNLSQSRAESVRDYLIGKGVAASQLDAKGFGPDRPIATNKTSKGREQNRRVEFTIPAGSSSQDP